MRRGERNVHTETRRVKQKQYENGITFKTMSQPKLFHSYIGRKMTVNDQVIRLNNMEGEHTEND